MRTIKFTITVKTTDTSQHFATKTLNAFKRYLSKVAKTVKGVDMEIHDD